MMRFTLPVRLDNNNGGQSRHWAAAYDQKLIFENVIAQVMLAERLRPTPADVPQRVTITRILGKGERLWDADSVLRGNAKQLIDALVDAGFFVDDGPRYIAEAFGKQDATRRQDGPAIEVLIEECDTK